MENSKNPYYKIFDQNTSRDEIRDRGKPERGLAAKGKGESMDDRK